MFGLVAIGFCLIAGLSDAAGALSAAAFLAMIYFSMPPLPGLPPNPQGRGHYLIVSKNLVEMLACLVIATTPSGHWIGFDALFFGAQAPPAGGTRQPRADSNRVMPGTRAAGASRFSTTSQSAGIESIIVRTQFSISRSDR